MPEVRGRSRRRDPALAATAGVLLLLLVFLVLGGGPRRWIVLPLAVLLPLLLPSPGMKGGKRTVRGFLAVLFTAGVCAVLALRSPTALVVAVVVLWWLPFLATSVTGGGGSRDR